MSSKAARHEHPSLPTSTRRTKPYRVVAVSLFVEEKDVADRLTDILRSGGWPKANRSLVMREALIVLQEQLAGHTPEEIFRYFVDRHARRAGIAARRRDPARRSDDKRRS